MQLFSQISVCYFPDNEQGETLFIGTELCPLLTAPAQIKHMFRLVAINMQQLRTFTYPLLLGQETLQIKQ